jgi:hypothetical protein
MGEKLRKEMKIEMDKLHNEMKSDIKVECQKVGEQIKEEIIIREQADKELIEHKESINAKCKQMVKQLSDFNEVIEELVAMTEDDTVKIDNKFQLVVAKIENLKEIVGHIVQTKCDEVSRRLGEHRGNLENKSEELTSQIEKLKKKQISNTEITLPQFDESKEANPMFHLIQLEEYFDLKKIPLTHRLVVQCVQS